MRPLAAMSALTVAAICAAGVSDTVAARTPERCASEGAKVLLANRYGDIYTENGEVMACNREIEQRQLVGSNGRPIRDSLDITGRIYAYAIKACDDVSGCETVINTGAFNIFGPAALATRAVPLDPRGHNLHDVARLRVSANKALTWIACRRPETEAGGDPVTRTSRECLGRRYVRYIYARPASYANDSERSLRTIRIASGRTIDPRYLSLTPSGRTIKWRQNGRLRVRTIGR